jgi:hypothetical protein
MSPLETVRDISLPLWVGSLAGIAGALALQTLHRFGGAGVGERPIVRFRYNGSTFAVWAPPSAGRPYRASMAARIE